MKGRYFPGVSSPFFSVLTIAQASGKLRPGGFVLVEHIPHRPVFEEKLCSFLTPLP